MTNMSVLLTECPDWVWEINQESNQNYLWQVFCSNKPSYVWTHEWWIVIL